jgi:4-methyl-5(b-hydroxyethyl)-thiazole monophosphate biosynthesis
MIDWMYQSHKWVAAICAAPLLLHDQGLLDGRRYTSHASTAGELVDRLQDEAVVVDGTVVTSQGAGTSLDFGLKLIELLVSKEKAAEVAASIAYRTC